MNQEIKESLIRDVSLVDAMLVVLPLLLSTMIFHAGSASSDDAYLKQVPQILFTGSSFLLWITGITMILPKVLRLRQVDASLRDFHSLVPGVLAALAALLFTTADIVILVYYGVDIIGL
ncbi:MAG: hypothetical protein VX869_01000 [Chloroflexota bacterium]|jgi:hypothetical protein|nr:hypothetical protein [Chloroflexota bacterium]MEC9320738.1 hypothetical protein [Chloroflexota bacterium]|tara:strand:+ start:87 stop:443 length:357 start_codon:yes stop_codon:yes gene_type:complete